MGAGLVVLNDGKKSTVTGVSTSFDETHQVDSFGRLRVSNPNNLFEYSFTSDSDFDSYWSTSTANGGTVAYNGTSSSYNLSVTTTTGSQAIIQSRRRMQYFSGKSHLFHFTANPNGIQTGVRKRLGLFDENNGWFFEADGTTVSVVIRSNTSGSVVDTKIAQANWNVDKLDGNGPSGYNAGIDNPNGPFNSMVLFWIDHAWLGAGGVRFGIYIDGTFYVLHQEIFANKVLVPYTKSANLPFRVEVETTGTPATADSASITCCAFEVEGKKADIGKVNVGNTGLSAITVNATPKAIFGLRINPNNPYSSIQLIDGLLTVTSGNSEVLWEIIFNPTITGTPTWSDVPNSIAQSLDNPTALTFTAGKKIQNKFAVVSGAADAKILTDLFLGFDINGVPDTFIIVARTLSSNSKVVATGSWKEYY